MTIHRLQCKKCKRYFFSGNPRKTVCSKCEAQMRETAKLRK